MSGLTRLGEWGRTGLLTAGTQAGVQLLGFASGILIIRSLAPEQYAYYTIANTALGAMNVLSDGGIGSGVLAQGGKVWQDRGRLGAIIASGLALRRSFARFAAPVALLIVIALLLHQGAGRVEAVVVAASILPLFFATLTGQLLEYVPRLHQHLLPLQRIQLGANFARLGAIALAVPLWPLAAVASLSAAIPQWWNNWRLRRLADGHADWRGPGEVQVRKDLIKQVARFMPAAIYYALAGQLSVWLISIFGHTESVAAVGALGRLAMIFAVLGNAFGVLAIPRFARIPAGEPALLSRRYWQSQAALLAAGAILVTAIAAFPGPVLAVLGPHYSELEREAAWMAASSIMSVLAGAAFSLGAVRGVIVPPWFAIPSCILMQVLLILLLPVETVAGVIWLGLLGETWLWLLQICYFTWTTRRGPSMRV